MYDKSEFPSSWRDTIVHFIDKSDGTSVRPISLTSCLSKIFERMLKNRLEWWVEKNNIIPKNQSGFRKGRSCIDSLANLTLKVNDSLLKKIDMLPAFLDVSGAFNNVLSDILLDKLAQINCSAQVIKFIRFITHERWLHTNIEGYELIKVSKGVPQGGVLSPLLYLIYVSNIGENIPNDVTLSQFADNTAIFSNVSPLEDCKIAIETAINVIQNNLSKLGLELEPKKTVLIHFNNKNIAPGETKIFIDNCAVKSSDTVRFLGITFDYKMTLSAHINKLQTKCSKALNIVKYLCGT